MKFEELNYNELLNTNGGKKSNFLRGFLKRLVGVENITVGDSLPVLDKLLSVTTGIK